MGPPIRIALRKETVSKSVTAVKNRARSKVTDLLTVSFLFPLQAPWRIGWFLRTFSMHILRKALLKIQARCDKTFKLNAEMPQHCPQAKQMQAPTRKARLSTQARCDETF